MPFWIIHQKIIYKIMENGRTIFNLARFLSGNKYLSNYTYVSDDIVSLRLFIDQHCLYKTATTRLLNYYIYIVILALIIWLDVNRWRWCWWWFANRSDEPQHRIASLHLLSITYVSLYLSWNIAIESTQFYLVDCKQQYRSFFRNHSPLTRFSAC